jgi:hypothetical protein
MVDKLADQFTTSAVTQRTRPALAFDLLAALVTSGPARADIATPARKKACTPDGHRNGRS